MLKTLMAWTLLASAVVVSALAIYWRSDPDKIILLVLILSVQASVFEGINMVLLTKKAS